jgi:hypothetical protein
MKYLYSSFIFSPAVQFFFKVAASLVFFRKSSTRSFLRMPSSFFWLEYSEGLSFLFTNKAHVNSFHKHLLTIYKSFIKINFVRLRLKGVGFRLKRISSKIFRFFFNLSNFFYFHLPDKFVFSVKKKRLLLISNELDKLKTVLSHLLLLKNLGAYRTRGLVYPRQIIQIKIGKKSI